MKVLVTGATGFLGNHLVQWLVDNTHCDVIASSPNAEKAKQMNWFDRVRYVPFDLGQAHSAQLEDFHYPDAMLHYGWRNFREIHSCHQVEENYPCSFTLIRRFVEQGLKNISVIGSGFEYGMINGPLTEDMNPQPISLYAIAKDALRRTLLTYLSDKDVVFKWIRIFNIYGPGQHPKSIFGLLDTAIQDGDTFFPMSGGAQLRDYIEVSLLAEYTAKVLLQTKINGMINCCSGVPISIRELTEKIIAEEGSDIQLKLGVYPYSPIEPMAYWGDNTKLQEILDSPLANDLFK
jgi:nucleoside-diphosphate-sugar epimerase